MATVANVPSHSVNRPHLLKWFQAADHNHSNRLSAKELRQILVEDANWRHFSLEQCALLISLFNKNIASIDFNQFQQLFQFLDQWKSVFDTFDVDHSHKIDKKELDSALLKMGYKFTKVTVKAIFLKYSRSSSSHKMTFESFVDACIHLHKMTVAFKSRDTSNSGHVSYSYDEIIQFSMEYTTWKYMSVKFLIIAVNVHL